MKKLKGERCMMMYFENSMKILKDVQKIFYRWSENIEECVTLFCRLKGNIEIE